MVFNIPREWGSRLLSDEDSIEWELIWEVRRVAPVSLKEQFSLIYSMKIINIRNRISTLTRPKISLLMINLGVIGLNSMFTLPPLPTETYTRVIDICVVSLLFGPRIRSSKL